MHVTVHVGMALRIGAVHWREVACCSVCQCCGNSRSSVVETWHHSTRRLLVKVAICKLLVPQCSQQCLTWEMWHAHAIWFLCACIICDIALHVCTAHSWNWVILMRGLAVEALAQNLLLWKLRPKLHKLLGLSSGFHLCVYVSCMYAGMLCSDNKAWPSRPRSSFQIIPYAHVVLRGRRSSCLHV